MNDTIRTCRVLLFCGVVHTLTFGFTAAAAANDPHRFDPRQPAAVVAETDQPTRPIAWRHGRA